jgi:hypothetical protein
LISAAASLALTFGVPTPASKETDPVVAASGRARRSDSRNVDMTSADRGSAEMFHQLARRVIVVDGIPIEGAEMTAEATA